MNWGASYGRFSVSAKMGHYNCHCAPFGLYIAAKYRLSTALIEMIEILTKDIPCLASRAGYGVLFVNAKMCRSFITVIVYVRAVVLYDRNIPRVYINDTNIT